MGLDMYLTRKHYVQKWDHNPIEEHYDVTVTKGGKPYVIEGRIQYVIELVGVWRKANQIHAWFVQNVQGGKDDCQESYVSHEQLNTLRNLCKAALADHEQAPFLLPTQPGFFFGGTDYDEYYFEDLEDTVKILDFTLKHPEEHEMYYHASW